MQNILINNKENNLLFLDNDGSCYATADESIIANLRISEFKNMLEMFSFNPSLSREDLERILENPEYRTVIGIMMEKMSKQLNN